MTHDSDGSAAPSARVALERLRAGNGRFVAGVSHLDQRLSHDRREQLIEGQKPFAIVLGCSDSRVPVEIVFDQGLGELFVIRVAGNIVAASQIGSVEFAAEFFGARLVVVLGHTGCGAIDATVASLRAPGQLGSVNLRSIIERIQPAIGQLVADTSLDGDELSRAAVRANVSASVQALRHGSPLLQRLITDAGLVIVGAEYALDTGLVEFFDA